MPEYSNRTQRAFPPTDETLGAVDFPRTASGIAFDATLARNVSAVETPAPSVAPPGPSLQPLSVQLVSYPAGEGQPPSGARSGEQARAPDLEVVSLLGEGGMGQVHLAKQRSLRREVAIKTVRPDSAISVVGALCDEAIITGSLEHPSIIPVHAFGQAEDGRPVMVMKRVEGVEWKELLHEPDHPLWDSFGTSDRLVANLQILIQVANALSFAHARGIVHRDLKPENVMIGSYGDFYLVDWGLALRVAEQAGEGGGHRVVGTPVYMAPEMVAGYPVDQRTDVYLLGATLHELLTGEPPHEGDTLHMVLANAYESAPHAYSPSVPDELRDLCLASLSRSMDPRPASARAFRDRLLQYLNHPASIAMTQSADAQLAMGSELVGADVATGAWKLADVAAHSALRRVLTESRFGYLQALDQWRDNHRAAEGRQRCEAAIVRLEVSEANESAARHALESIDEASPELVALVDELSQRLAHEREEAERMRRLAHDLDESVGLTARRRAALGFSLIAAAVGYIATERVASGEFQPWDAVRIAVGMGVVMLLALVFFRHRLAANAFGMRIVKVALLGNLALLVHRVFAAVTNQPIPELLATDCLMLSGMLAVGAVTLARWMAGGALLLFFGAIGCIAFPEQATRCFSFCAVLTLIGGVIVWRPQHGAAAGGAMPDP